MPHCYATTAQCQPGVPLLLGNPEEVLEVVGNTSPGALFLSIRNLW